MIVVVVEPQGCPEHGVVANEANEPILDEVVEPVVERAPISRGCGARERPRGAWIGHWPLEPPGVPPGQAVARSEPGVTGRGLVSASAARVATMVVSMSSAVTP